MGTWRQGVLRDSIDFNIPILIKCPQYPKLIRKSDWNLKNEPNTSKNQKSY